jgi:hypothetical protein
MWPLPKNPDSNPIDSIRLSSMNSIGSAHADRFYARESAPVSTPDRILFISAIPENALMISPTLGQFMLGAYHRRRIRSARSSDGVFP